MHITDWTQKEIHRMVCVHVCGCMCVCTLTHVIKAEELEGNTGFIGLQFMYKAMKFSKDKYRYKKPDSV